MDEIATTFEIAGFPGEFQIAAAEIYHRITHFKGEGYTPDLERVHSVLAVGWDA